MTRKVKIGLLQMESKIKDVEYNIKKAGELIKKAKEKGADIVCLPELFATGYNLEILKEDGVKLGVEYYKEITEKMSMYARENSLYLIAPYGEVRELPGVLYNSAVFFDRKGEKIGSFAKSHLWALERFYYKEGSEYPVFDTDIGKIGIIICYDAGFPEAARTLCLKGAEIIFIPAAWRILDEDMWDLNISQRALENTLFTVGVNRTGFEGDLHLFGKSKVCNPRGTVIHEMPKDKECVDVVEIDLDELIKFRNQIPYLKDRRPMIYDKLVEY